MPKKCCLYGRRGEEKLVCTTDASCPTLRGWSLVGSWGVENCEDCFGVSPESIIGVTSLTEKEYLVFVEMAKAYAWVKENWNKIFPRGPPLPFKPKRKSS